MGATTVRGLQSLDVQRAADGVLLVQVRADAFCHSMVRSLVGALTAVGEGRKPADWPASLLTLDARANAVAVLPGFVSPDGHLLGQTITLSLIYVAIATAIHASIVTAAGAARIWLQNPERERFVRRVLSVALALVAVWFAWKARA